MYGGKKRIILIRHCRWKDDFDERSDMENCPPFAILGSLSACPILRTMPWLKSQRSRVLPHFLNFQVNINWSSWPATAWFHWFHDLGIERTIHVHLIRLTASVLWSYPEENGWSWLHTSGSLAELHKGLEFRLHGEHEWRRLHPGWGICHWIWKAGN